MYWSFTVVPDVVVATLHNTLFCPEAEVRVRVCARGGHQIELTLYFHPSIVVVKSMMASEIEPESVQEPAVKSYFDVVKTGIKPSAASTEKSSDTRRRLTAEKPEVN